LPKLTTKIRTALGKKLSLSSKLFLRELLAVGFWMVSQVAGVPRKFLKRLGHDGYSLETPEPPRIDFTLPIRKLTQNSTEKVDRSVEVETSIIIPVFNKAEFTFHCLRSLTEELCFSNTEVIVVDNASTDETAEVLSYFSELIRVIRNEENLGFVDACNQGAAAARGKYLLFLNNDTQVLPGWLKYLVETIEANPANGAVGSMFLYPDGSIQEAGSIVWRNGEAHHYGWSGSPDDRRFNFAREVDYCSAASLLIRTELFQRLGGFDRRFAPAYYEDVDLCFGVRSLGYRVIYQPMSRVVHYEGVTAGADTTRGFKQFQIINREKFVEKWRDVLELDHLPRNPRLLAEASIRNWDRPRIIVFDERVPSPDRDAGSLRMFLILKTLTMSYHVIFVPFNRPQSIDYERALWKFGIETADAVDYRRLLRNKYAKAAIVSRPSMAETFIPRIRRANPRAKIVFDMVDTHFIRLQREHEITGDSHSLGEAKRYRKLERRLAQASDVVWSASAEDKRVMEREVPGKRIEVVPTIHELRDTGKSFAERQDLLFIGNMAHRPNEDAVLFFMKEVYPLVRRKLPEVRLDIIGDNSSAEIAAYNSEQVRIRGYVPDVEPYLLKRRVFVAPLRFGAGIKGKVGEAMAHGVPVVTTSIGAEGFGLTNEFDVMIGDDPASFAAAVARLYSEKELWERVGHNGRLRISKHFTPEVVAEIINESIKEICSSSEDANGPAGASPPSQPRADSTRNLTSH
jgi:GT2 family glycosyltransferase